MSNRTCTRCEMYCIEDILHIITQCPHFHDEQTRMYEEITKMCPNVQREIEKDNANAPYYLLGKIVPSCDDKEILAHYWMCHNQNV